MVRFLYGLIACEQTVFYLTGGGVSHRLRTGQKFQSILSLGLQASGSHCKRERPTGLISDVPYRYLLQLEQQDIEYAGLCRLNQLCSDLA